MIMPFPFIILILFLCLFTIHFLIEQVLSILNTRHVQMHSANIPQPFQSLISEEKYSQSSQYTLTRLQFGRFETMLGAGITLLLLFSGLIPWLDTHVPGIQTAPITHGVLLILAFIFITSILQIPMEWYETFHIEARFGFNQTTVKTFLMDKAKSALLSLILGIPILSGILFFMTREKSQWWIWSSLLVIGFQFLMMLLYPLLIAPFFNRFTPLEDGELKNHLTDLAQKCKFTAAGIYIMDGSKRSNHSNAYFTGMGKGRRIVLYDTLVQQLNIPELTAVLAHEIGHYQRKHIMKMLILSSILTFVGFYVLSLLINWPPFYQAFGILTPSIPVGILIFTLITGSFTFWIAPCFNLLSRKHEYEADRYAAIQTGNPEAMKTALLKLSEKNLSNLTPHPWYSAYHYSHPTLLERLEALKSVL